VSNPPHRPPRVFTEQEIKECFELSDVLSQKQLADYFGCTPNTLRAAFERQTELSEAYRKGKALGITKVAKSLAAKALDGDINAAKFYLSHQAGWSEVKRKEITGKDGEAIQVDHHWTIEVVE